MYQRKKSITQRDKRFINVILCMAVMCAGCMFSGSIAQATEQMPEQTTEQITEQATEQITEQATEQATEQTTVQEGKLVKKKNGKTYYKDANGKIVKSSFVTIGKKTYYFGKNGAMVKGWMKKGKKYYYFDRSTGVQKKKGTVDGIKLSKGGTAKKTKSSVKKINMMIRARKIVEAQTKATDTKSQKLKKIFKWMMKHPYKRYRILAQVRTKKNWEVAYANDIFVKGSGCCVSYSSALAYLAKECGYKNVKICDDTAHAWVEINGYVYDVLFAKAKSFKKYYKSNYKKAKLVCVNRLKV